MSDLKTLKDLRMVDPVNELRQEAIKWIRTMINNVFEYKTYDELQEVRNTVSWIKHFFNITEEDLK